MKTHLPILQHLHNDFPMSASKDIDFRTGFLEPVDDSFLGVSLPPLGLQLHPDDPLLNQAQVGLSSGGEFSEFQVAPTTRRHERNIDGDEVVMLLRVVAIVLN